MVCFSGQTPTRRAAGRNTRECAAHYTDSVGQITSAHCAVGAPEGFSVSCDDVWLRYCLRAPARRDRQADDAAVPAAAKRALAVLGQEVARIEARLAEIDAALMKQFAADPLSRPLAKIPGVGPTGPLNLALRIEPGQFQSGRHFAAWLGLVPRQHSSGGKQRLGGISRTGDERLRQLLVLGASALIRQAKPGRANVSPWLLELLKRRPRKLVAVAWANKVARIVWAMMTTGAAYRGATAA
jgi:transposase